MSEIKSWYAGKTILLTGSTGFIGKVLLEKILRALNDINSIYLLLRAKRNENFEERCKSIFSNVVSEILSFKLIKNICVVETLR